MNDYAKTIITHLSPYASRITLAGSIRRGNKEPNDIDIVLIPKNKIAIHEAIKNMGGKIYNSGQKQVYFKYRGVDVNIYYADHQDYGAQLLTRTGSAGHNIGLRRIAQTQNKTLNQYGVFNAKGDRLAGRTEHEIYTELGRPRYKKPEERI